MKISIDQLLLRGRPLVASTALYFVVSPCVPAAVSVSLDVNALRSDLANQGYLHFTGGEELTGWTDIRNPAFYDGRDGKSTTLTNSTDIKLGYDRTDFQVKVQNVIVTDQNNVAAGPAIQRDFNYADQAYRQLGITVLSTGNIDAKYNTVTSPVSDADAATIRGANRPAKPVVPNYYIQSFSDGSFGDTKSPEDGAANGTIIADTARSDTFAHELGHYLLDASRFSGGVHSGTSTDLMADGGIRSIPNATVKSAAGPVPNQAPAQPGQAVGTIGGLDQFSAKVGAPAGPFVTAQIDGIFANQSDGTAYVQRSDHHTTFGDRADFNWVEDNIPLEEAATAAGSNGRMDNHPGFDFLTFQINPAAVPGPLDENALGHVTPGMADLNLAGFAGPSFRYVDVVSQIARYGDMDVGVDGLWSPRESALDYTLQFSSDGTSWVFGTPTTVYVQGWTTISNADDWLARWVSPIDAKFVRIQADTVAGMDDRNVQIDAIIAGTAPIPEPGTYTIGMLGLLTFVAIVRRRGGLSKCNIE